MASKKAAEAKPTKLFKRRVKANGWFYADADEQSAAVRLTVFHGFSLPDLDNWLEAPRWKTPHDVATRAKLIARRAILIADAIAGRDVSGRIEHFTALLRASQIGVASARRAGAATRKERTLDHEEIISEFLRLCAQGHTPRQARGILVRRDIGSQSQIYRITKPVEKSIH